MKIERINENQIRCTLTKEDLLNRHIRISELVYGSENAKSLFKDMMEQAFTECGFEADYIPIMVEAVPLSSESLVLIITKVEDPEELDTRFSSFTKHPDDILDESESLPRAFADEFLDARNDPQPLAQYIHNDYLASQKKSTANAFVGGDAEQDSFSENAAALGPHLKETPESISAISKIFSFSLLETVRKASLIISPFYNGQNTLFKDSSNGEYYLLVQMNNQDSSQFNKVCNILSEFGKSEWTDTLNLSYFNEHFKVLIKEKAIQTLAML